MNTSIQMLVKALMANLLSSIKFHNYMDYLEEESCIIVKPAITK